MRPGKPRLADAMVFTFFTLLAAAITWPMMRHALTAVPGDLIDPALVTFILSWQDHALLNDPSALIDAPYFYPFDNGLLLSEQLLGGALISLPVWALTHNPALTANFMTLMTYPIGAFGMYLLIRDLTGSRLAGVASGLAFAFTSYRLSRLPASHVLLIIWIPYALLTLRRFFNGQKFRHAVLLGLFVALQVISTNHGAFMVAFAVPIAVVVLLLCQPSLLKSARAWAGLGLASIIAILGSLPVVLPYLNLYKQNPDFQRDPFEIFLYSSGLEGLLTAPGDNLAYARTFDVLRLADFNWEKTLFPGLIVVALAAAGLLIALVRRQKDEWRFAAVFGVLVFFGLAMSIGTAEDLDKLYGLFVRVVPGFDAMRVAGRFAVVTSLGLAGLTGLAVARLKSFEGTLPRIGAVLIAAALIAESWPRPFHLSFIPERPEVYGWLEKQSPAPVLELPTGVPSDGGVESASLQREALYLYYAPVHRHPILNGYAGNLPPGYIEMVYAMVDFPDEISLNFLRDAKVGYIIIHGETVRGTPWSDSAASLQTKSPGAIVRRFGQDIVVDVRLINNW